MYICNKNVKILNDLPRWDNGANGGKINREDMVGMALDIEYYGEIYEGVEILEYIKDNNPKFKVRYYKNDFEIDCSSFLKGNLGKILGVRTNEFKVEIGQVFKDDKRDLVVLDREYRKDKRGCSYKYCKYKCNKCGWTEGWIVEYSLLGQGTGCSCCCNRTAVLGINTIYDTDKWMIDLGVSEEDARSYTKSSDKKISVVCPDCGKEKNIKISDMHKNKSISCNCGDGTSYPEKIVTNLLHQLNIDFQTQLSKTTFEWCRDKRYDFYIPSLNMIIETHGAQHYKERSVKSKFKKTLREEQKNDTYKKELAKDSGIENYIVLDCSESDLEYIKNGILNSKLNELFDLTKIDWLKCEEFALNNVVKEVCEYWNNKEDWETTKDLAMAFKLDKTSIINYLKKGVKLRWCSYDVKEEARKGSSKSGKLSGKKVEIFKNYLSLGVFESCAELERQSEELFGVRLLSSKISLVCNGKRKKHKGYTFKYIF